MSLSPQNSDYSHIGIIGDSKHESTEKGRLLEHDVHSKFRENTSVDSQVIERTETGVILQGLLAFIRIKQGRIEIVL
jgi:hypothetical protein